jgi:enoyl-CoA hydratase/carnithine racemase
MVRGEPFGVDEAHALGIVTQVLPDEDFGARVLELARGYCPPGKASLAVGRIKRAVHAGADVALETGLALERELQQQLFTSEDAREGIRAFVEKRRAIFRGR